MHMQFFVEGRCFAYGISVPGGRVYHGEEWFLSMLTGGGALYG